MEGARFKTYTGTSLQRSRSQSGFNFHVLVGGLDIYSLRLERGEQQDFPVSPVLSILKKVFKCIRSATELNGKLTCFELKKNKNWSFCFYRG